jgi:hypothetical protein
MVRLAPCGCGTEYLVRIERAWWMRAFGWRRLYFCTRCRARLFIRKPAPVPPGTVRAPAAQAPGQREDAPQQRRPLATAVDGQSASASD